MKLNIKYQDTGTWRIVVDGDYLPTISQEDGTQIEKPEDTWTVTK